jgi:hypothetical protein
MELIKKFAVFSREHIIITSLFWFLIVHIFNCIIRGLYSKKTWDQIKDDVFLKGLIDKIRED